MDVLSYLPEIPLCVGYLIDGKETDKFPFPTLLNSARPVIKTVPGWQCEISSARKWEELPKAAQEYVLTIEKAVGCPITYVSVGAERDRIIVRK